MKKIIALGLTAVMTTSLLGCQVVEGVGNITDKSTSTEVTKNNKSTGFGYISNDKISSDTLKQLKFIDKHSYKGVSLRRQRYSAPNGIVPITLYNTEKKKYYNGFINNKNGGYILPIYDSVQSYKVNFFESGLEPVMKNGKYGYINIKGEEVIDFKYEEAENFINDIAAVKKDGGWGYIDKKGSLVIKPEFKQALGFIPQVDVALVTTKDDKKALVNTEGKVLIKCDEVRVLSEYDEFINKNIQYVYYAAVNNNKCALVKVEKGSATFITDYKYIDLYYYDGKFQYSKLKSQDEQEFGILDENGKEIKQDFHQNGDEIRYDEVHNGRRVITDGNGLCGIADENKKVILSPQFTYIHPFVNKEYSIVDAMGKQGLISREGELIIEPGKYHITPLENKEEYVAITKYSEEEKENGKCRLYDVKRRKYIGKEYLHVFPMNDDFVFEVSDMKSGLMNKNGEIIVEPYENYSYEEHKNGYIVKNSEKGFYITDLQGKKLSDEIYQSVQQVDENGYRVVIKQGKYGLADKDGNLLIPCTCESIKAIDKTKAQLVLVNGDEVVIGTVEIPTK